MVRRGLAESREAARLVIESGKVTVGGAPAAKASRLVAAGEALEVSGLPSRYVSRGGHKLEAALDGFGVEVAGRRVLDAGSSTGGFTDCVLQRGAAVVLAVDVGYGLLHERIRSDPRVECHERTNIRRLRLEEPVDVVVADLSFLSLRGVVDRLVDLARPDGDLVMLVKPQFEASRAEVDRGRGVVRDPGVRAAALAAVKEATSSTGATVLGEMESPLRGASGNVEYLLHARAPARRL